MFSEGEEKDNWPQMGWSENKVHFLKLILIKHLNIQFRWKSQRVIRGISMHLLYRYSKVKTQTSVEFQNSAFHFSIR